MTPDLVAGVDGALLQATADSEMLGSAIFVFLVSLLVGTVAINVGARLLIDSDTGFRRAAVTALIGAVVYTLVGFFLGGIPLLGPLLMLIAWIAVINWQYPGGWGTAVGIGVVAWIVAVLVLYALSWVGVVTPEALGVPGA